MNCAPRLSAHQNAQRVVLDFLAAQDDRDLDKMCNFVTDDIIYINEPHDRGRDIVGKKAFRLAFANSPCIWAEEANLHVKRMAIAPGSDGDGAGSCCVFVERLDSFVIDGKRLSIPICGYLIVNAAGLIQYWKDYWCYKKYKEEATALFGPAFSLFQRTKLRSSL